MHPRPCAAAALAMLLIAGSTAMSESIFPYAWTKDTLANGLTVIMVPMESNGLVAYYSIVRTGSRDEVEPGKSGFAHFFEHMMFRGTKKYPGAVYDSILTSIGADANAYTTDDYTAYHLNFAREDLEKVIELESDRFENLSYEEPAFQTEAGAVYGEYRKSITSPYAVLNEKVQDLAYDVHPYKHTTIGFEADIKAMPQGYAYSTSFFTRYYRPDNVVLLIVGDMDPALTMRLVARYYGGWRRGYVRPAIPTEPPQRGKRGEEVVYKGKSLPIIDMAYKGDAFDPANSTYAAAILLGDLAFGETSALYKQLVLQEQKVEFISASVPMNRDQPLFEIVSMVKKAEDLARVREAVENTLRDYATTPVDGKRLSDLKKRNKYSFLMGLDTPDHVAGGLARMVAVTGGIEDVDSLYRALDAVTPQDIMRAVSTYFVPDRLTVVVLKGDRS